MYLVVGIQVYNERGRYIEPVINQFNKVANYVVILDDASTDGTPEYIESLLTVPYTLIKNKTKHFHEEYHLRSQLWNEVVKHSPEWIWICDADELVHPSHLQELPYILVETKLNSVNFPLYDLWDKNDTGTYYRDDHLWCAHNFFSRFIVRYDSSQTYTFPKKDHHSSRYPQEVIGFSGLDVKIPYLHMGWMRKEDRLKKYERYMMYDPEGKWGSLDQYKSILDDNPNLVKLEGV